jgi:hypothetical protein
VYTVTHPYGTFTFSTDAAGDAISTQGNHITFRTEDPVAASPGIYFPPDMQAGTNTHIGPWLMRSAGLLVDPVSGHTYVGDPAVATTVTGSPFGTNSVTVTGPNIGGPGVNSISQNLFTVSGRVFTGKIPTPLALDRVTYSRNSAGGHVDAFVTTSPASSVNISGTGIATTPLAQNVPGTGKFFATVPFTPSSTLPTSIVVTNLSDLPTPTPYPVTLVDDVAITQADYNTVTKTLTVKASSTDQLPPAPTLTLESLAAPVTLDATGTAAVNLGTTIPPLEVVVNSSKGGSEFAPVRVVTPGPAPLAVNDAATTAAATPVVVNVLANDTVLAPNTIDPTTVTIGTTAGGTAVVNPTNGSVTYTPAVGFSGPGSFTYSVKDNFGQVSNLATVAVTVAAPPPPPPLPTSVLVTPNIASPQLPNVPITFLAGATGGSGSYQYQWSIKAGGQTTYTVVAPYGSSNSWIWTPTLTGAYDIQVDVRNAGSTAATEAHGNFLFYQIETPATAVVLAASPAATQVVANPVVFTATASGGSGPYEYRFWLNDGTAYFVVQDWNTVNSWTWTPGKTGIHDVFVEVRRFGTQDFRDAFAVLLAYQITP